MSSSLVTCVVVADGARARFFTLQPTATAGADGGMALQERSDLCQSDPRRTTLAAANVADHSRAAAGGTGRDDDASAANRRREWDRRFAGEVIDKCAEFCRDWQVKRVVIVADPRTLGLLRHKAHRLAGLDVRELGRDLSHADAPTLRAHLVTAGLLTESPPPVPRFAH